MLDLNRMMLDCGKVVSRVLTDMMPGALSCEALLAAKQDETARFERMIEQGPFGSLPGDLTRRIAGDVETVSKSGESKVRLRGNAPTPDPWRCGLSSTQYCCPFVPLSLVAIVLESQCGSWLGS